MQAEGVVVQARQRELGEVNDVPTIIDGLQAQTFSRQHLTDKDMAVTAPGYASAVAHFAHRHGRGILGLRQARGKRARRCLIAALRWAQAQSFMRPLLVVLAAKLIETPLLRPSVAGHGTHGFLF